MSSLSIHILTTWKNKDRQESILETWLKDNKNYFFYTDKSSGIGNQIEVFNNDTYFSNGAKNISELIRIKNEKLYEQYDWFLFCDDDTVPNLNLIKNKLNEFDQTKCYGKLINSFPQLPNLHYFSGGAGYFISSSILKKYDPPGLHFLNVSFYSDVCVGLWMDLNNIEKVNINNLNTHSPEELGITDIKSQMSFHYIKSHQDRHRINKIFNSL